MQLGSSKVKSVRCFQTVFHPERSSSEELLFAQLPLFKLGEGANVVIMEDEVVIPQRTCDAFHRDKRCNHDFFITEICEFLSNELSLRGFIFNRKNDDTRI